jgi:hypothetical protein
VLTETLSLVWAGRLVLLGEPSSHDDQNLEANSPPDQLPTREHIPPTEAHTSPSTAGSTLLKPSITS